jgi:hypothetical protein
LPSLALISPQPGSARGGTRFKSFGALALGNRDPLLVTLLGRASITAGVRHFPVSVHCTRAAMGDRGHRQRLGQTRRVPLSGPSGSDFRRYTTSTSEFEFSTTAGRIDPKAQVAITPLPPLATGTVAVSHDGVPAHVLDLLVRER